ncbi:MAG: DUF262 domain-containing protein [Verrucomicrobia bacterium]|nr:DUF262 domain-containing protein [Verrucomicrobiota bacterium]
MSDTATAAVIETELDLEPLASEAADAEAGPIRYELFTFPADFTLEVLHQKWKNREILIPPMQRGFVWTQYQASRLIESFLLGLPVPSIFLYVERGTEKYLVVDGQQRLRSIFYFLEESFGEEKSGRRTVFRLTLPDASPSQPNPWNGKKFSELRSEDALKLKNSILRAFIMKQVQPGDDTSIYHVFERLNTGGTLLTPQEVRNAVYGGPFNEMLHELNEITAWREILGKPKPDPRLRDIELMLRFLALYKSGSEYEKPMKTFLTDFMRDHRQGQINPELRPGFVRATESIRKSLGAKPFHLRAGLNAPVFDAVSVAFARHSGRAPKDIRERYDRLLKNEDFEKWTRRATTDVEAVKHRISLAAKYLFE